MFNRRSSSGFTLIELMITVAIIAILSRIAYGSYAESVSRSKRAQAQTAIISLAQAMERYYTKNNTYATATLGTGAGAIYPSAVPATGGAYYTLSLSNLSANNYTITATRNATGVMKNDKCGDFTFTAAGTKSLANYDVGKYATLSAAVAACWR
jgi:type IV pilus assembly protein PilE